VFDLLGRDAQRTRSLFKTELDLRGSFTLTADERARIAEYGFVSGSSTHADRLATIRDTDQRFATVIDTHTADGLKVAREHVDAGVPMIVLETALPAKFAESIVEALGREPDRPAAMRGIEQLPKRFDVMKPDVEAVKAFISART
jgi:threonine synthase